MIGTQHPTQALSQLDRFIALGQPQQHDEFLAAKTGKDIAFAQRGLDDIDHATQDGIADQMAKTVVDLLEVINVDHDQRRLQIMPLTDGNLVFELAEEMAPVVGSGQFIMHRLVAQPVAHGDQHRILLLKFTIGVVQAVLGQQQRLVQTTVAHHLFETFAQLAIGDNGILVLDPEQYEQAGKQLPVQQIAGQYEINRRRQPGKDSEKRHPGPEGAHDGHAIGGHHRQHEKGHQHGRRVTCRREQEDRHAPAQPGERMQQMLAIAPERIIVRTRRVPLETVGIVKAEGIRDDDHRHPDENRRHASLGPVDIGEQGPSQRRRKHRRTGTGQIGAELFVEHLLVVRQHTGVKQFASGTAVHSLLPGCLNPQATYGPTLLAQTIGEPAA